MENVLQFILLVNTFLIIYYLFLYIKKKEWNQTLESEDKDDDFSKLMEELAELAAEIERRSKYFPAANYFILKRKHWGRFDHK